MTPKDYAEVKQLFAAACDLDPPSRIAYLDEHCSDQLIREEVEALLAHDGASVASPIVPARNLLDGEASSSLHIETEGNLTTSTPRQVGPFRVVRRIGEGGMGTVFEAMQDEPQRRIALKLIRAGHHTPEHLRRFRDEAAILARLNHHGIARIYAAGTASNDTGNTDQPYFAMEFVDGTPLDQYLKENRLTTRQRVALLARVADAVHHAHQKGVIHRDLKPGNILVEHGEGDPQPKVVDFGVARVADAGGASQHTQAGQLLGTLAFMSPEQASGDPRDLDLRSDVYALGVVAFQILSGALPHDLRDMNLPQALQHIREAKPKRLADLAPHCAGDLALIVHKAMDADPAQRYDSAAALAADLRRYLQRQPIAAHPPSVWYQLRRFVQRNRALTGTLCALVLVMFGATFYSLWQRSVALGQAERADAVRDFLTDLLGSVDPDLALGRDNELMRSLLDQAADRIDVEFGNQPEIARELHGVIGRAYHSIAGYRQAEYHARAALQRAPENSPQHALHLSELGHAQFGLGDLAAAETTLEQARVAQDQFDSIAPRDRLATRISLAGVRVWSYDKAHAEQSLESALAFADQHQIPRDDPLVLGLRFSHAQHLLTLGVWSEALPILEELAEGYRSVYGPQSGRLAEVLIRQGTALRWLARLDEAEEVMVSAVEMHRQVLGTHDSTAEAIDQLAELYSDLARYNEAIALMREAITMREALVEPTHIGYTTGIRRLGNVLRKTGNLTEAEAQHRRAVEILRELNVPERLGQALSDLGNDLTTAGRYNDAEPILLEADQLFTDAYSAPHANLAASRHALGRLYFRQGRWDEAIEKHRQSLELRQQVYGTVHPEVALTLDSIASVHMARREYDLAEPLNRESLAMVRQFYDDSHPEIGQALNNLAVTLSAKGERAAAIELYEESLEIAEAQFGRQHREVSGTLFNLGAAYYALKDFEQAEPLFIESIAIDRAIRQPNDPRRGYALVRYGALLIDSDRAADAVPLLREAAEIRATALGATHRDTGSALSWLGEALLKTSDYTGAIEAIGGMEACYTNRPLHDSQKAAGLRNKARAYVGLGQLEEAEMLLLELEEACANGAGPQHPRTTSARKLLVALYERWGEEDEAQRWRDTLPENP